ncbi:Oxidoreductase FAD/NAD(P)-binding protein [Macrophomina phaseolina MS6]|uniref:Oxidoreductase FAD/NAD(P)-binding protein n=1 Tax=Macrophomina phaseolina (strain MS6) TaxID=1126212 RepID=K2RZX0_MACPH|nr:Oxidoreductase FAD/NAD(P)-binding protein [Macrophomina phaseolina MS6]
MRLAKVEEVNSTIRLFKLRAPESGVKFLPGQWLDVYLPGIEQAGGFTITSAPAHADKMKPDSIAFLGIDRRAVEQDNIALRPYLELAVQQSPNKPAAWLWRPKSDILGSIVDVRVGGSFVWPPPASAIPTQQIQKAVFIAGGVGINPLISIVAHLHQTDTLPPQVEFIYATKSIDGEILFADRLLHIASSRPQQVKLHFFLTGSQSGGAAALQDSRLAELAISPSYRRLNTKDVLEALSSSGREQTVCYVCGPPQMTDELVDLLRGQEGMSADRVLCEKWW